MASQARDISDDDAPGTPGSSSSSSLGASVTEGETRFVFKRATSEQISKHFSNNGQMWAAPLSTSDYKDLQRHLAETEASMGSTAYWVLLDGDVVVCSCTTYMRDALVNQGHGMRSVKAAVVSDVFTLPDYRRRGLASQLLRRVQAMLDQVSNRVEFSLLFSHARPDFYGRLGWTPQPARQLRVVLGRAAPELAAESPVFTKLFAHHLVELGKIDVNMTKLRLSARRDECGGPGNRTLAQLLPSHKLMRWHQVRAAVLQKKNLCGRRAVDAGTGADAAEPQPTGILGAASKNLATGGEAWAWWTHELRWRRLILGRLLTTRAAGLETQICAVLDAAAAEANRLGFREVVVWEPSAQVAGAAALLVEKLGHGAHVVEEERSDVVPCLRWHGGAEREGGMIDTQFYAWS